MSSSTNESHDDKGAAGRVAVGAAAGTGVGLVGSVAAISSSGTVAGLSGAGITSGLAAIGGTMLGGAAILTCGTVLLAGAGGFAAYKLLEKKRNQGTQNG